MTDAIVPFRWDVSRRERLGRLVPAAAAEPYPGFRDELRRCCARSIALAGDARLIFVGRSPQYLYDYLSGALAETSWRDRLTLLHYSKRGDETEPGRFLARHTAAAMALSAYFKSVGLDPRDIGNAAHPLRFVDVVWQGDTFGSLTGFLLLWAREVGVDWRAVQRRLGYVGLTLRESHGPKTWRWQKNQGWLRDVPDALVRNVSADPLFWSFIGIKEPSVTPSHGSWRWNDPAAALPVRDKGTLAGLALAVTIHGWGTEPDERAHLARLLAGESAMREAWLRKLVLELKARNRAKRMKRRTRAGGNSSPRAR
jgi:hypothetical protein